LIKVYRPFRAINDYALNGLLPFLLYFTLSGLASSQQPLGPAEWPANIL